MGNGYPRLAGLAAAALLVAAAAQGARLARSDEAPRAAGARMSARIAAAIDGDTVRLRMPGGATRAARLIGVDTPETVKPGAAVGCFGPQASAHTKRRLPPGTRVTVRLGTEPRDRYGRALVYLYRRHRLYNLELVRRGFARPLAIAPNDRLAGRFAEAARRARAEGRGLWGACKGARG